MASPKFIELLERLPAATKSGKVRWEQTAREGVFRIILGEGIIHLESGDDRMEKPWRAAYLLDHRGQKIDQVEADAKSDYMFEFLDDLYKNASQSAYKFIDDVVDSMLAELETKIA